MVEQADCSLSKVRVRYAETDQMGVAYYANYLVWFEVGRADFCRMRGFTYDEMERTTGTLLMVAEAYCRYRRPVTYDMEITVRTTLPELHRRTVVFGYDVLDRDEKILAVGWTKHIVMSGQGRPCSFPDQYRARLAGQQ